MNIVIVGCGNLGFETARLLAGKNKLLLIDIRKPAYLPGLLEEEKNVHFCQADATDLQAVEDALDSCGGIFKRVDVLLGTVGVLGEISPLEDFDKFRACFELNFLGNAVPIKAVLARMLSAGGGRIIVLSSSSGHFCPLKLTPYSPSKWALENFCKVLRREVEGSGITVDVFSPSTLRNRHSQEFHTKKGLDPVYVAGEIAKAVESPSNSNHFIPGHFCLLYPLEKFAPFLLDAKFRLLPKNRRRKIYRDMEVETVLITDALSGLGKALARVYGSFAKELYLFGTDPEALFEFRDEITQLSGCRVHVNVSGAENSEMPLDLAAPFEHADLVINNAECCISGSFRDIGPEEYRQAFSLNFFLAAAFCVGFLKRDRKPKKIINILSTTAFSGKKEAGAYSSTKAALWNFTRSLRRMFGVDTQFVEVFLPPLLAGAEEDVSGSLQSLSLPKMDVGNRGSAVVFGSPFSQKNLTFMTAAEQIRKSEKRGEEIVFIPQTAKFSLFFPARD